MFGNKKKESILNQRILEQDKRINELTLASKNLENQLKKYDEKEQQVLTLSESENELKHTVSDLKKLLVVYEKNIEVLQSDNLLIKERLKRELNLSGTLSLDFLKLELFKYEIKDIQAIYDEIKDAKKSELSTKQAVRQQYQQLAYILVRVCKIGKKHVGLLKLLDLISETDGNDVMLIRDKLNNVTVMELLESHNKHENRIFEPAHYSTKTIPIYVKNNEQYLVELQKYYLKFGIKIMTSNYLRIIRNGLIVKDFVATSITEKDLLSDIYSINS